MEHEVAVLVLVDQKGQALLQLHGSDDKDFPNRWCLFGGHLHQNEKLEFALQREIFEELGYETKGAIFSERLEFGYLSGKVIANIFAERYVPGKKLKIKEGQAMKWFLPEKIKNLQTTPRLYESVCAAIKKLNEKEGCCQ